MYGLLTFQLRRHQYAALVCTNIWPGIVSTLFRTYRSTGAAVTGASQSEPQSSTRITRGAYLKPTQVLGDCAGSQSIANWGGFVAMSEKYLEAAERELDHKRRLLRFIRRALK